MTYGRIKTERGVYCSACSVCSHQKLKYTHFLKFGNYLLKQEGGERKALEDALFPLLFWGSPIGLGTFFAGLGYSSRPVLTQLENLKRQKISTTEPPPQWRYLPQPLFFLCTRIHIS